MYLNNYYIILSSLRVIFLILIRQNMPLCLKVPFGSWWTAAYKGNKVLNDRSQRKPDPVQHDEFRGCKYWWNLHQSYNVILKVKYWRQVQLLYFNFFSRLKTIKRNFYMFLINVVKFVTFVNLTLRSEEHTSELQSRQYLVCRLLLEKKKKQKKS